MEKQRTEIPTLCLLQEAILKSYHRYGWPDHIPFCFTDGDWSEESVRTDIQSVKKVRKDLHDHSLWFRKINDPCPEELCLFVDVARKIMERYSWPTDFRLNIMSMINGTPAEIVDALKGDYEALYQLRQSAKKDRSILKGWSVNIRVMTTLEGLIFHAIRSVRPFVGRKSRNGLGHIRWMRCLEGLLFQVGRTMNPEFSPATKVESN